MEEGVRALAGEGGLPVTEQPFLKHLRFVFGRSRKLAPLALRSDSTGSSALRLHLDVFAKRAVRWPPDPLPHPTPERTGTAGAAPFFPFISGACGEGLHPFDVILSSQLKSKRRSRQRMCWRGGRGP